MTAAEGRAVLKLALDGDGEHYDGKIGGSVQAYGKNTENNELEKDVAAFRRDELRDEGQEEERGLWIENFREDALAKRAGWLRLRDESWIPVPESLVGIGLDLCEPRS